MTAVETDRDRLLALFAMSQELPPFAIDYHAAWLEHCRYLDASLGHRPQLDQTFSAHNADFEAWRQRPTIFVTLHFDRAFTDGIGQIARTLRRLGMAAPLTAIVGGDSTDRVYDGYLSLAQDRSAVAAHELEYVGVRDAHFSTTVMATLRRRGALFAVLDANQGSSEVIDAPFLYHRLNVRSGLFRLAHASRALVQPFMVDSTAGRLDFGPRLDARAQPIRRTAEEAVRFLGHHVLLRPERWEHWRHYLALSTQRHTNTASFPADSGERPAWYLAGGATPLGFHTGTRALFELDVPSYRDLVAGKTLTPAGASR